MQDQRVIICSIILLSLASYTSVTGAAGSLVWLAAFAPVRSVITRWKRYLPIIAGVAIVSCIMAVTGGDGLGYGIRLTVVTIVGCCAWAMIRSSDPLGVPVWLLGNRLGFDLGMSAALVLSGISVSGCDLHRGMQAVRFKTRRPGPWELASLLCMVIERAVVRTEEQARVLALRGYRGGGSYCPAFTTTPVDIIALTLVFLVFILAFLPFSDVFILRM